MRRLDAESAQQKAALMRKERDEKRKEAEWNKANSIAQIILNTAQAVAKTYAEAGFFGGLAGAIAVGAIGAAELGIAIATPIPQFEKGTDYKPTSGPMIVGEKGSELMITPSGKQVLTPDKPTLMYGERGTKIIPHDEVNRMLLRDIYQQTAMHIEKNNDKKFDELKEAVVLGSQAQVSAMKKIRNSIIVNVDSGLQAHYKKLRS